jgi:hypothetical protein
VAIKVRDADLLKDRAELVQFLNQNLEDSSDPRRFDWLYLGNPNGPAKAWIAIDDTCGRTVGVSSAFPRIVVSNGQTRQAYVLGDFCIAPDCRSLGPAMALQRFSLQSLCSDRDSVCFDFPSQRMVAIYRRLGVTTGANIVRHVKLLRLDSKIRHLVPQPVLAGGLATVGNLALRLGTWRPAVSREYTAGTHEGNFGAEFADLSLGTAGVDTTHVLRSPDYLNWRYLHNPLRRYRTIVARRGAELAGYAAVAINGTEWRVDDLFARDGTAVKAILAQVEALARDERVEKLTALMLERSRFRSYLTEAGFYPREGHPVIAYSGNTESGSVALQGWFLMDGDRES